MKIKDIFSKDIERQINPAVVVSKQDPETVKTEIDEYVFSQSTIESLYKYLNNLINNKQDKTGIWINGFYGSGKSHFIKYIFYCLNNEYSEKAFNHYIEEVRNVGDKLSEASTGNITALSKKIQKNNIDTIIFNIDAVSGQRDDKEKITKIIFNQFNGFRGYNSTNIQLALLLEKHLDQIGKFDEFKSKINANLNTDWLSNASRITSLKLNEVLKIASELDSSLDIDFLRNKLKNPDDITIADHLIPEFVEYLSEKPKDYRLVFLVDEISQYIGMNTNLLLNLQTIIEEVGAKCENKIWLTTTAQQTLEDLVNNTENKGEDFGKILGRFETRISLESQDTTYITQKRILDKNSNGIKALTDYYNKNKDGIENQFIFQHDRYKGFDKKDTFILSYPFIPYQFKLISDVFENFAQQGYVIKEVKDNERSLLAITHYTAKIYKDKVLGEFITFDTFFNDVMKSNVTHHANKILEPALSINEIKSDDFAKKVVYTLFMISNISDTKKLTFPPSLDHLILLLIDTPEVNRLELQNKIQKVLDTLLEKTIIYKEDDRYNFYKEEEIDVAKQINNTTLTLDDRLSTFDNDLFQKCIRFNRKVPYGNNNFSLSLSIDDKEIVRSGDIPIIISVFDKAEHGTKAINVNKTDLVCCVNEWFAKDETYRRDFETFVKTKKFIRLNSDSAQGTRKRAIEKFADQNNRRIEDLQKQLKEKFLTITFISNQQILKPSDLAGSVATDRFNSAVEKHLSEIYKKNQLANSYASSNDDLKKSANEIQFSTDNSLTEAEVLVNASIDTFGALITVYDVINQFQKPPYGWKDTSTIDILIKLFKKNKRKYEWRGDIIDIKNFVERAIKTTERQAIVIKQQEAFSTDEIKQVRLAFREIFNQDLKEDNDFNLLVDEIKQKCQTKLEFYQKLSDDYYGTFPFGIHFSNYVRILNKILDTRNPKALFEYILKFKDANKKINDNCKENEDFISNQLERYITIKEFTFENQMNFESLDEAENKKAEQLIEYFKNDDMPGNSFPQIRKVYEELSKSLKDLVEKLKNEAKIYYQDLYKDVEDKIAVLLIKEPDTFFDKDSRLKTINTEKNISNLQLILSQADDYKAKILKLIIEQNAVESGSEKTTEVITDLSCVIESEEQLDLYIDKLKQRLLTKLKENKIIIIK